MPGKHRGGLGPLVAFAKVEAVRIFPAHSRTHDHLLQSAARCPLLGALHKQPPDATAAQFRRHHKSGDFRPGLHTLMVADRDRNPARNVFRIRSHKGRLVRLPYQRFNAPPHRVRLRRISQFAAQERHFRRIQRRHFTNADVDGVQSSG